MIIESKLNRQSWGPKKVLDYLRENGPQLHWPADSTAGAILKRAGLVKRRVRCHRVSPYSEPFENCQEPNQIWSADFKGDFVLGNHRRCYPLTVSDNFSRYRLLCPALDRPSYAAVRFEWAFRQVCRKRFGPITVLPLLRWLSVGSVNCRNGGSNSAFVPRGLSRANPAEWTS